MKKHGGMNHARTGAAVLSAAILALTSSCVHIDAPAWSHFYEVGNDGWSPEDILVFEPISEDSTGFHAQSYDFTLILRSSTRHPIERLPVAVTAEDANGAIISDTIIIDSADKSRIDTRRSFGVTETTLTLMENERVGDGFLITVAPLLEADESRGLLNVGIEMRENGSTRERRGQHIKE